jgi:peptidoglycan/xylan/chitin deacetylase (PgdA/CDA1 family)
MTRYALLSAAMLVCVSLLIGCRGEQQSEAAPGATTGASPIVWDATPVMSVVSPIATSTPTATATATSTPTPTPTPTVTPSPTPTPLVQGVRLTPQQIERYQPNELGQIPILVYHHFGPIAEQFTRTPEQFRADLQWLYEHDFYVVNLEAVITVLTFDDSPASQFDLIPLANGNLTIAPNCAVAIMEEFFRLHPDFGRGGHFAVLPTRLFNWHPTDDRTDQTPYAEQKLRWLLDNGYEIGNHTVDHVALAGLSEEEIKHQLATAVDMVRAVVPETPMDIITLPYGAWPDGNEALLRGFEYQGRWYQFSAAMLVGANPVPSPLSSQFNPYRLARIQAYDEQLDYWFAEFEANPGILYVSDGDPTAVTVPNRLHPWIDGTLDLSKVGGRDLIRYGA